MKRFALLALLLFVSAFSNADSIKLTPGSETIYPRLVAPGYVLQFSGSGSSISIPDSEQFLKLSEQVVTLDV